VDEEDPMTRLTVSLSIAAVLACALASTSEAKGQKKKGPATHSMTGCLQKGAGNMFTLTSVEGTGPKTVEIVATAPGVNLSPHVGHKIEITGTTVSASQAAKIEAKATSTKKDMKEEKGEHHMRVVSMKMIGTTCP
jgi:hypothetical protein